MNRRTFFKITAGLTALCSGVKSFALGTPKPKTALDRVCVRRLLLEIQKYIKSISQHYVFQTNTEETRKSLCDVMNSYLTDLKNRRAFYDYNFVCDETNNPPINLEEGRLDGMVVIHPTKTAEWIVLDFSIVPTIIEDDFRLEGWDYIKDPLPGYEIKDI